MKTWLFALLGLIIFVILGILNQWILDKNTDRLAEELKTVAQAIHGQKWQVASQNLKSVQKNWRKLKPTWSLLLHHREIDNIDQALIKTERAIRAKSYPEAEVEQGSLENYVEHVPKREEFNLVNIF